MKFFLKTAFVGCFILVLLFASLHPAKRHTVASVSMRSGLVQIDRTNNLAEQRQTRANWLRFTSHISAATTTTTTVAPATTVPPPTTTPTTLKPALPVTQATSQVVRAQGSSDFWKRLSNCESSTGTGGNGGGYFQFSSDTAAKVGYQYGQSYATQLAEAQRWAAEIHPNEGSTSGWPHCWWVALDT